MRGREMAKKNATGKGDATTGILLGKNSPNNSKVRDPEERESKG